MFTGSEDDPPPLDSYVRDIELGKSFPLSVTYGTEKFTANQLRGLVAQLRGTDVCSDYLSNELRDGDDDALLFSSILLYDEIKIVRWRRGRQAATDDDGNRVFEREQVRGPALHLNHLLPNAGESVLLMSSTDWLVRVEAAAMLSSISMDATKHATASAHSAAAAGKASELYYDSDSDADGGAAGTSASVSGSHRNSRYTAHLVQQY